MQVPVRWERDIQTLWFCWQVGFCLQFINIHYYCSLEKIEVARPIVSLPLNFGKNNAAEDVITCFQVESRGLINNY